MTLLMRHHHSRRLSPSQTLPTLFDLTRRTVSQVALDEMDRFPKVLGGKCRVQVWWTYKTAILALPSPDEDGTASDTLSGLDVSEPIADHI